MLRWAGVVTNVDIFVEMFILSLNSCVELAVAQGHFVLIGIMWGRKCGHNTE